jgi:hypothetical protein
LREQAVNETEALLRIEHYVREEGLVDTPKNGTLITNFVASNGGRWSASIVDLAIVALKAKLVWRENVVEPAPSAPPAPQPAPVELLPNGEPRLPFDVVPNKSHSAAQLKDYLVRVRK